MKIIESISNLLDKIFFRKSETIQPKVETTVVKEEVIEPKVEAPIAKVEVTEPKAEIVEEKVEAPVVKEEIAEIKEEIASTTDKPLSKKEQKIVLYTEDIQKHYGEVDNKFLEVVVNSIGPVIYRKNAEIIHCDNPKELITVKKNFLIKKLGLEDTENVLDNAIQEVCTELKDHSKYRATVYYRLAKKFNRETSLNK